MNFRTLTGSLLAATTLLTAGLPAYAGPFDLQTSPIFRVPGSVVTPTPAGNGAGAVRTPAQGSSSRSEVGNTEIQGLGDHDSWVNTDILAEDPRALCSDVGLGNNTRTNASTVALGSSSSDRSSSARSHNNGGGGGVSILGIGVSGSGSSQGSQNASQSSDRRSNRSESFNSSSSTVEVGRNCDAFVESAAARDMNYEDNLTERYRIRSGRRGDQVDNLLEVR